MKNSIVALTLLLASAPSYGAVDVAELNLLTGHYTLKQAVFGACYPELFVKRKEFLGHQGPALGIYGGPGKVLAELHDINEGAKRDVQSNPMTGREIGYLVSSATLGNGRLRATQQITDLAGNVEYNRDLNGRFDGTTFSFDSVELNSINGDDYRAGSCVYEKTLP